MLHTNITSLLLRIFQTKPFQGVSENELEDSNIPKSCDEDTDTDDEINGNSSLHWKEEDIQGLMQDLNEPLPEPFYKKPILSCINLLLRWLCCFILYWQVVTCVSDTAVEWLLLFLGKFFEIFGNGLDSELLNNFILYFPTSIYMLHMLL